MVANNKLISEKSPYLVQHAHNPVDWFPWGEAAFDKAQSENKPIFLSIGYSTCHWCHVMAEESFEDEEVAEILNKHFIAIKVDREERPDIDAVYMKVCQMMTGQGGWPLTIVMTPNKVPFYAGTYFPKYTNYGMPGMIEMLSQLAERYQDDPKHIAEVTANVEDALAETVMEKSNHRLNSKLLKKTYQQLAENFDTDFGGFSPAPKFPQPQNFHFLFDYYIYKNDKTSLSMAEKTLQQMFKGGIYDHIGFGFSRYATDRAWLVPHFEKMLYDNAQLLSIYTRAYSLTKNPLYKQISEQIIVFISREMRADDGVFYSAIDADSEGEEGKYYVWNYETVMDVLGEELGEEFADVYGMTPAGNFHGQNIPNLIHLQDVPSSTEKFADALKVMLQAREKRIYPHVDDKVLTSWNAMMIDALAYAGHVFHHKEYLELAKKSMHFIESHLFQGDRLMARYRDGETKFLGYLDDYANLIQAYLTLYEATYELSYLKKAKQQTDHMLTLFWDQDHGGFFLTGNDAETLISREKEVFDGALPSGNAIAISVLTKISALTGEQLYMQRAEEMYYSFYEDVHAYPRAAVAFMNNLFHTDFPRKEVVIIGDEDDSVRQEAVANIDKLDPSNVSVLVAENAAEFKDIAPFASNYKKINDKTTIYVCENFSCKQPTNDMDTALSYLKD